MPDLELVFDFDGWKLNSVYIFSEPAAFAFLGVEDTPPTETTLTPGLLTRLAAGLSGRKVENQIKVSDDESLIYAQYGLSLEYENNCVYEFEIHVQNNDDWEIKGFPGKFIFGTDTLDLTPTTSVESIKNMFGTPDDEDTELEYISYNIQDYALSFWFDEHQHLERIVGNLESSTANEESYSGFHIR